MVPPAETQPPNLSPPLTGRIIAPDHPLLLFSQPGGAPMTPERWQRAKEIFQQALDLPATERAVFVADATGDDATIRAEVESLLTAHDREDGFSLATDRLPGNAAATAAA